jgi:hypothetical protein
MAQAAGNVIINADGSVTGTNNIQQTGSTYTLTGNVSSTVQVQKSNIVIDGAGYAVNAGIDLTNGVSQNPTRPAISNVTIKNLYILNGGVWTNGGGNDTFYNDGISNFMGGAAIFLLGAPYNNITHCTLNAPNGTLGAIAMIEGAGYNTITENNIIGGINLFLSVGETVDRNYWSDYLTRYPNAAEIDNSGIGDTPYVFSTAENGSETVYYQDNHPLMQPVSITVPEFPVWIILPTFMLATLLTAAVYFKKRKH